MQIVVRSLSPRDDYMEMHTREERADLARSAEVVVALLHSTVLGAEERLMTHIQTEWHSFASREAYWPWVTHTHIVCAQKPFV